MLTATGSRLPAVALGCVLALALTLPAAAQTDPAILGFAPAAASAGSVVRVDVEALGAPIGGAIYEVHFNGVPGTIVEPVIRADSSGPDGQVVALYAVVPPSATTGPISVLFPDPADPGTTLEIATDTDFEVIALQPGVAGSTGGRSAGSPGPSKMARLGRRLERGPITRVGSGSAFSGLFERLRTQLAEQIRRLDLASAAGAAADEEPRVLFRRLGGTNFASESADSRDLVVGDFDGDDDQDVFVPQSSCLGCPDADTLYLNGGNDAVNDPLIDVLGGVVTGDLTPKRQARTAVADVDGDGHPDVVPPGFFPLEDTSRIRILVNDGSGMFGDEVASRVTNVTDLLGSAFDWNDVEFGDVDGDGDLDVAIANRCEPGLCGTDATSALLIDEGPTMPGTYTAYPTGFGEPPEDVHHDILLCDLTGDGLAEVVFSQDIRGPMAPLRLGLNEGGSPPTFADASAALVPNPAAHTLHLGCGDFDGDGMDDLHVGVFARSDRDPTDTGYREDMIYLNESTDVDGDGSIDETELRLELIASPEPARLWGQGFDALTYSAGYGDFDGDGSLDILLGSVSPDPAAKGPFLMLNENDGTFTNLSAANDFWPAAGGGGFEHFNPTGLGVADLNDDGYLDVAWGLGDLRNGRFDEANRIFIQEAPPVAEICADVEAECAGPTTDVVLDGTCSSDPENGDLTYAWSSATCSFDDASSPMPTASCPLGSHVISLVVTDPTGLSSDPDEAMVIIEDTTPPTIDVAVSPDELWPPNHKLVTVIATIDARDVCDPDPQVTLISVSSNEPDNGTGDGDTSNDIQNADIGTDDRVISLRAERKGNGNGRIYTIVYGAEDQSGNTDEDTAYVTVPHDQGNGMSATSAEPSLPGLFWKWVRTRP